MEYQTENVSFNSGENTLKGRLFKPENSNGKAFTIIGPVAFVKEQAPTLYAQSLASKGYTAIIFDPTYHGESEGDPRQFECGDQKAKDIMASVDYLESLQAIDTAQIFGMGICQGVNWMINAVNKDPRLKAVCLVAGHYLTPSVAELYNGGKDRLNMVLEKSRKAKDKFSETGEVEYIPIVGTAEQEALLAAPPVYDWYIPWENNANGKGGQWKNRITRMSLSEIWGGDIEPHLKKLGKPALVIHSNKAASGPVEPKRLFDVILAQDKELIWFEDQHQTQFYDDEILINRTVGHIDKWLTRTDH